MRLEDIVLDAAPFVLAAPWSPQVDKEMVSLQVSGSTAVLLPLPTSGKGAMCRINTEARRVAKCGSHHQQRTMVRHGSLRDRGRKQSPLHVMPMGVVARGTPQEMRGHAEAPGAPRGCRPGNPLLMYSSVRGSNSWEPRAPRDFQRVPKWVCW